MFELKYRSLLVSQRAPLFVLAGSVCLFNLLQACGASSSSSEAPADPGATAGASGSAGDTGTSGTPGTAGSGVGGAAGASGSTGTSGAAGTSAGASGAAGAGAGAAGASGSAGSGSCDTPPAGSPLVGWASQSGMGVTTTTGGGAATPVPITTLQQLAAQAQSNQAKVLYVKGVLTAGKVKIGSNTTIVGLCGAEIHGHLSVDNVSNVIVRNIKVVGFGSGDCSLDPDYDSTVGCSSGNDAITVVNSAHHIWFDHLDVSDGTDGNLDITQGSDFVTVSWTKFHYKPRTDSTGSDSTGAEGHRFSNLIGGADNVPMDTGHLNITWHHDWWADNVNQRMPRSRAGKIHMFNNVFTAMGDSYCSNAGQGASLLVENSVFDGVKAPFQVTQTGVLTAKNDVFTNTNGQTTGSGTAFTPPYAYTPDATGALEATVEANAGPQ